MPRSGNALKTVLVVVLAVLVMSGLACWAYTGANQEGFESHAPFCNALFTQDTSRVSITSVLTKKRLHMTGQADDNIITRPLSTATWRLLPYRDQYNLDSFPRNTSNMNNCAVCIKLSGTSKDEPGWFITRPKDAKNHVVPKPQGSLLGCGPDQMWYVMQVNSKILPELYSDARHYVDNKDLDKIYVIASSTRQGYFLAVPDGSDLAGGDVPVHMSTHPNLACLWVIKMTSGPKTLNALKLPDFQPTQAINAYPDADPTTTSVGVWMPQFNEIWNKKFHFRTSGDSDNTQAMTINMKSVPNAPYGQGTVDAMYNGKATSWTVKSYGQDFLSGLDTEGKTRLTLQMVNQKRKGTTIPQNEVFLQGWVKDLSTGQMESLCGHNKLNMAAVCSQMIPGNSWQDYYTGEDFTRIDYENNLGIPKDLHDAVIVPKPPYDPMTALDDYWYGRFWSMQKGKTFASGAGTPIGSWTASSSNDCAAKTWATDKADRFDWNPTTGECKAYDSGSPGFAAAGSYGAISRYPQTDILGANRQNFTKADVGGGQAKIMGEAIIEGFSGTVGNINDCLDKCAAEPICDQVAYNYYDKTCRTGYAGAEVASKTKGDVVYSYVGSKNTANATTKKNYDLHGIGWSYLNDPKKVIKTINYTPQQAPDALNQCAAACTANADCRMWTLSESDKGINCDLQCTGTLGETKTAQGYPTPTFAGKRKVFNPRITDPSLLQGAAFYPKGALVSPMLGAGASTIVTGNDKGLNLKTVPNAFNYPMQNVCSMTECVKGCKDNPWCNVATFDPDKQECLQYSVQGDINFAQEVAANNAGTVGGKNWTASSAASNPTGNLATYVNLNNVPQDINQMSGVSQEQAASAKLYTELQEGYTNPTFDAVGVNNTLSGGFEIDQTSQPNAKACQQRCMSQVGSGCDAFQYDAKSKACITRSMMGADRAAMTAPSLDQGTYSFVMNPSAQAKEWHTVPNTGSGRSSGNRCDYVCAKDAYGDLKKLGWQGARSIGYALDANGKQIRPSSAGAAQCLCYRTDGSHWYRKGMSVNQDPNTQWVMGNNGTCDANNYCWKNWNNEMSKTYTYVDNAGKGVGEPWKGARAIASHLGTPAGTSIPVNVAPAMGSGGKYPMAVLCRNDPGNPFMAQGSSCATNETQGPFSFPQTVNKDVAGYDITSGPLASPTMNDNVQIAQDNCAKSTACSGFVMHDGSTWYKNTSWPGRVGGSGVPTALATSSQSPIAGLYKKTKPNYLYQAYSNNPNPGFSSTQSGGDEAAATNASRVNTAAPSTLRQGDTLPVGSWLYSPNKRYAFVFQHDGNIVTYDRSDGNVWWTASINGRGGASLQMQSDGNLVVDHSNGSNVWQSNTHQTSGGPFTFSIDDNAYIHIKNAAGKSIWSQRFSYPWG
jgi:hypothetical protein